MTGADHIEVPGQSQELGSTNGSKKVEDLIEPGMTNRGENLYAGFQRCDLSVGGTLSHDPVMRPTAYTAGDLKAMTIADIKSLSVGLGYGSIKAVKKNDVIAEFLTQQRGDVE